MVLIFNIKLLKHSFMNTASDWLVYPLWTLTTFTTISKVLDDVTSGVTCLVVKLLEGNFENVMEMWEHRAEC